MYLMLDAADETLLNNYTRANCLSKELTVAKLCRNFDRCSYEHCMIYAPLCPRWPELEPCWQAMVEVLHTEGENQVVFQLAQALGLDLRKEIALDIYIQKDLIKAVNIAVRTTSVTVYSLL